jgi:hypothetical protein
MKAFYLLLFSVLVSCNSIETNTEPHVLADLYYRYEANTGRYTAEAKMTLRDSIAKKDTAYRVDGGVAFLNSGMRSDIVDDKFIRYKNAFQAKPANGPSFSFKQPSGKQTTIPGTLAPFDSLIMGPAPTKNFGFTVYHTNKEDFLAANETLSALFQPDNDTPKLATILGPRTDVGGAFKFSRETVADWPLTTGTITFIKRRVTPIYMDGVEGQMVEEVYSKPVPTAMVN